MNPQNMSKDTACLAAMKQSIPAPLPRSTTTSTCRAMPCRGGCPTSWMGMDGSVLNHIWLLHPCSWRIVFSFSSPCLISLLKLIAIFPLLLSSAIYKSKISFVNLPGESAINLPHQAEVWPLPMGCHSPSLTRKVFDDPQGISGSGMWSMCRSTLRVHV